MENTNELQSILNSILEDKEQNLLPSNLREGVTLLGVSGELSEGIDTSDGTATAEDIIVDKTAYVNGQKITGNITTTRIKINEAQTVRINGESSIYTVDLYRNLAISGSGRTVYIYRIINGTIEPSSVVSINTEDFGVGTSFNIHTVKFSIDSDYDTVGIWASYNASSTNTGFCHFVLDVKTLNLVGTPIWGALNLNLKTSPETNYTDALYIFPRPEHRNYIGLMRRQEGDIKQAPVGIVIIKAENNTISIVHTSAQGNLGTNWGGRGFTGAWDSTGRYFWGRAKVNNALTNTSYCHLFDCLQNKNLSTNGNLVLLNDNYACDNNKIYHLPDMAVVKTHSFDIFGRVDNYVWSGFTGKYFMYNYGSTANLFTFDISTLTLNLIKSFSMSNIIKSLAVPNKHITYYSSQLEGYMFDKDETVIEIDYQGHTLYYPYDADGISSNILDEKKVYGIDGKIIGTMPNNGSLEYTPSTTNQSIPAGYTSGGTVRAVDSSIDVNIIAENIKKDISILGVTGTLDQSASNIKMFSTVEEMNNDTTAKEGDLAVVYREEINPINATMDFQTIIFPKTVTLPTAFTDFTYCMFRSTDDSVWFDANAELNSSMFRFGYYGEDSWGNVSYESSDGITYTRTDGGEDVMDLGIKIRCSSEEEWDDYFGYFMFSGGNVFEGLYEYGETKDDSYLISNQNNHIYFPVQDSLIYSNPDGNGGGNSFRFDANDYIIKVLTKDEDGKLLTGVIYDNLELGVYYNGADLYINKPYSGNYDMRPIAVNWENNLIYSTGSSTEYDFATEEASAIAQNISISDEIVIHTKILSGESDSEIISSMPEISYDFKYLPAPTQLTLNNPNQLFPDVIGYGKNGVEQGTLGKSPSNRFDDINAETYATLLSYYATLSEVVIDDTNYKTALSQTDIKILPSSLKINTTGLTTMNRMFNNCRKLIAVDIRKFDTSLVTNMSEVFQDCRNVIYIEVNGIDTSAVTNMEFMFYYCEKLSKLDISDFHTSNVTSMKGMFQSCSSLSELDLTSFDTSKVINMTQMFYNCSKLTDLDLSSFDMSTVTTTTNMFTNCSLLQIVYVKDSVAKTKIDSALSSSGLSITSTIKS